MKRPEWAAMIKKQQLETAFNYHSIDQTSEIVDAFTEKLKAHKQLYQKKK